MFKQWTLVKTTVEVPLYAHLKSLLAPLFTVWWLTLTFDLLMEKHKKKYFLQRLIKTSNMLLESLMIALILALFDHLYYMGINASHWEHLTEGQIL